MRRCIRTLVSLALCFQVGACVVGGSYEDGGAGILPAVPPVGGASLIQTAPTGGFLGGSGFTIGGSAFGGGFSAVGVQQGSINLTSP